MRHAASGTSLLFAATLALLGCAAPVTSRATAPDAVNGPTTGAPPAATSATDDLGTQTLRPTAMRYVIFARHAHLDVKGHDSVMGDHVLSFSRWSARIDVEEPPHVEVDIDLTSLESREALIASLVRNDFLETSRYPHATLVGTLSRTSADGGIVIDGTADIHGTRSALRFVGTIRAEGEGYRIDAAFDMSRRAFGLTYAPVEPFLDDVFRIVVSAVARPERVDVIEQN
jgi:polyisoprenoid-binding protein YceI